MKFRIGPFFAESRSSQDRRNLIEIQQTEENTSRVCIGLLAESFDSALTFNILLTEAMARNTQIVAVELRGRNVRRLSTELNTIPVFASKSRITYLQFPSGLIAHLFNLFWLASSMRILGLQGDYHYSDEIWNNLEHETLPPYIEFVIEKKSAGIADFLCVQCDNQRSASLIAFLRESSTSLKHPLVETRIPV